MKLLDRQLARDVRIHGMVWEKGSKWSLDWRPGGPTFYKISYHGGEYNGDGWMLDRSKGAVIDSKDNLVQEKYMHACILHRVWIITPRSKHNHACACVLYIRICSGRSIYCLP